jgi:hypothetical protein
MTTHPRRRALSLLILILSPAAALAHPHSGHNRTSHRLTKTHAHR